MTETVRRSGWTPTPAWNLKQPSTFPVQEIVWDSDTLGSSGVNGLRTQASLDPPFELKSKSSNAIAVGEIPRKVPSPKIPNSSESWASPSPTPASILPWNGRESSWEVFMGNIGYIKTIFLNDSKILVNRVVCLFRGNLEGLRLGLIPVEQFLTIVPGRAGSAPWPTTLLWRRTSGGVDPGNWRLFALHWSSTSTGRHPAHAGRKTINLNQLLYQLLLNEGDGCLDSLEFHNQDMVWHRFANGLRGNWMQVCMMWQMARHQGCYLRDMVWIRGNSVWIPKNWFGFWSMCFAWGCHIQTMQYRQNNWGGLHILAPLMNIFKHQKKSLGYSWIPNHTSKHELLDSEMLNLGQRMCSEYAYSNHVHHHNDTAFKLILIHTFNAWWVLIAHPKAHNSKH